jgi:hypothetical protein
MKREFFTKKYANLNAEWVIDSDILFYILRRYDKLLINELDNLKDNKIKLPKYFKDRRTDQEYLYDIIDGWVIEDVICDAWLRPRLLKINSDIEIKVMGTNRDRVIQKYDPKKITTNPDLIFSLDGKDTAIELQMARSTLINGYDMKVPKVQRAINENNFFLWIIIPENKYFIIEPKNEMQNLLPIANPLWGGKLVYHIDQNFIKKIGGYKNMKGDLDEFYVSKLRI